MKITFKRKYTNVFIQIAIVMVTLTLCLHIAGCSDRVAKLEQNQSQLQQMIEKNLKQISASNECLATQDKRTQANFEEMQQFRDELLQHIEKLSQADKANSKQLTTAVNNVKKNQAGFQTHVDNRMNKFAKNIDTVNGRQDKLQANISNVNKEMASDIALLDKKFVKLQTALSENTKQLTENFDSLRAEQKKLKEMVQTNIANLSKAVAKVSDNQDQLKEKLSAMETNTRKMLNKVTSTLNEIKAAQVASAEKVNNDPEKQSEESQDNTTAQDQADEDGS